jgi:hypothetical protein
MGHTKQNLHITTVWNNIAPPPHIHMARYKKEKGKWEDAARGVSSVQWKMRRDTHWLVS